MTCCENAWARTSSVQIKIRRVAYYHFDFFLENNLNLNGAKEEARGRGDQ